MLDKLHVPLPIIQAPMAGVSTPALAAEVSNAGGIGSLGIGATDAVGARRMIEEVRSRTDRTYNVNVFTHGAPTEDPARDAGWIDWMRPVFAQFDAEPPERLRVIYKSFADDPAMLAMLLEMRPPVVSFHFGLPPEDSIRALKAAGITLWATATSLEEAQQIERAGIDAVVAQGIEAGGHRGVFDPSAPDDGLGTLALTRILVRNIHLPVVAAGGIMDGAGIRGVLALGAEAAQLGTAFIACPESSATDSHRAGLTGPGGFHTRMTNIISGRPARALANRFIELASRLNGELPPHYPIAYDAGKALHAAAKAKGEHGFGAHWAGQGAPLARTLPAAELVATLAQELVSLR